MLQWQQLNLKKDLEYALMATRCWIFMGKYLKSLSICKSSSSLYSFFFYWSWNKTTTLSHPCSTWGSWSLFFQWNKWVENQNTKGTQCLKITKNVSFKNNSPNWPILAFLMNFCPKCRHSSLRSQCCKMRHFLRYSSIVTETSLFMMLICFYTRWA